MICAYMWLDSFMYGICDMSRSCICDMTRSYMWHDSFIYVTWFVHTCDMTRPFHFGMLHTYDDTTKTWRANVSQTVTVAFPTPSLHSHWLIFTQSFPHTHFHTMSLSYSDVTRSYIWRDLFVCVTWLAHICDTTKTWQANVSRTVALALTTPSLHSHSPPASYGMVSLHALSSIRSKTPFSGSPVCTTWLVHTHDTTHRFYQIHTVIKPLENTPFRIVHMYGILHRSYVWHDEHCLTTYTL